MSSRTSRTERRLRRRDALHGWSLHFGPNMTPIELRGDRRLSYASVEPVLRACGAAGAMNIRLAVEHAQ